MKTIHVPVPPEAGRDYDVVIEPGALKSLPKLLSAAAPAARYAFITDSNVAPLYAGAAADRVRETGVPADLFVFPAGESSKCREEWAGLTDAMVAAGTGRDGCVVAVGGGVCGDLAGFVAATYMRGIPCVLVPTSLLAMVDAAIGGKTGIDTPPGKNLVGAFHPPRAVISDPEVLASLPDSELRSGLVEAVKHGAIADAAYLDGILDDADAILRRDPGVLARLVARSVEIKAAIVGADVFETGIRSTLNFGHTIAHAIERLEDWRIPHGHAVAIGMVVEAELGETMGVTADGTASRLRDALLAFGLPVRLPANVTPAAIVRATASDKKARAGRIRYALLERPGTAARAGNDAWTFEVDADRAAAVLAHFVP